MAPGEFGRKIAASAVMTALRAAATDNNLKSTAVGVIAAAVVALPGLNVEALLRGDVVQIAHVISALLIAWIGVLATKARADGKTSAIGAAAGALYAVQGSVEAVVTGMVIASAGYFTNKGANKDTNKDE